MPVVTYDGPEMDPDTAERLIAALTDAVVSVIPNIPPEAYYVYIRDHSVLKIGVGGKVLPKYLEGLQSGD